MLLHKWIYYSRPLFTRKWFHADNIHRPAACYPTHFRKCCYLSGSIPHDRFSTESDGYYRPAINIPISCRLVKCRTKFIHVHFRVIIYCLGEKICAIEWEAKFDYVYGAMKFRVFDINADTFLNLDVSESPIFIFLMKNIRKAGSHKSLTDDRVVKIRVARHCLLGGCVTLSAFSVYSVAPGVSASPDQGWFRGFRWRSPRVGHGLGARVWSQSHKEGLCME